MKIGIVGLGLIGGSLGLDLRSLGHQVLGVSRQERTCKLAVARGAADEAAYRFSAISRYRFDLYLHPDRSHSINRFSTHPAYFFRNNINRCRLGESRDRPRDCSSVA